MKFAPRVRTPAWVFKKIKKDTEEEARIAAKDSHPEPTVESITTKFSPEWLLSRPRLFPCNGTEKHRRRARRTSNNGFTTWKEKIRSSRQFVEKLFVDGENAEEERKLVAAIQIVTPPTTPRKEVTIRLAPPKTLLRVATPLAQEVLKRNLAKRKEKSTSDAMEIDNESAPITGRPGKAPRQHSPTPGLMHSKHATGVDKKE
ncbi:hypothetical protein BDD12DRAFT_890324 [Trichophaea hybrida]|nr:hypothetical protein BDD12DRAFT_890324 [Trichophaea hybrida]